MLTDFSTLREGVVDDGYSTEKLVLSNKLEPTKKWLPSDDALWDPTGTSEVDWCGLQREEVLSCRQPCTTCLPMNRLTFGDGGPMSHCQMLIQIQRAPKGANHFVFKRFYFSVDGGFDTRVFDGSPVPRISYSPLPVQIILSFHCHSCAGWHRFLFRKWENGWVRGSVCSFSSFIPPRGSRGKVKLQSIRIAEEQSAMERL